VANAVFDGSDAIMLSAETAAGKFPVEAVRTMARIAEASERRIDYQRRFARLKLHTNERIAEAISHAACYTSIETGSRVIICCTRSGATARYVSNYRPPAKIAVASPDPRTLRRTMLYWNTHPIHIDLMPDTDSMMEAAKRAVCESGIANKGERVVIVAGVPVNVPGTTNMVKADTL
jgi:pyruvate kinase